MTYTIPLNTLDDTKRIAEALAVCLPKVGVVTFSGRMGAGKTTFIAYLIESLYRNHGLVSPHITSPTFSLIHEYDIADYKIVHSDVFRLDNPRDVFNIGLLDYMDTALCLIEWADNIADYVDNVILKCHFICDNDRRILTMSPCGRYSLNNDIFNTYINTDIA